MPFKHKQWLVSPRKNWFHRLWASSLGINRRRKWVSLAAFFDVKFGKKIRKCLADSRGRTADALLKNPECVALAIEGSNLRTTEDNFVPTARCIQDTKTRQLVTRSSLQRLRCCVCHRHHEQAMKALHRVRQFFARVLKKAQHYRVDVIAGDANAAAHKYHKKQENQDLYNSSVAVMLREMRREVNMNRPFESRHHIDYSNKNHHSHLRSTDYPDCCFVAILSRREPPGPRIVRKLWSNTCERTQSKEKEQAGDNSYLKGIEVIHR